jgi:hypothetical protein
MRQMVMSMIRKAQPAVELRNDLHAESSRNVSSYISERVER